MVFEPRLRGHHLSWLQYITEDFLSAGFRVTLAVDGRSEPLGRIRAELKDLMDSVATVSLFEPSGRLRGGGKLQALAACLAETGADEAFLSNFDEVASSCLRRAAMGLTPPAGLRGRINGVYFRPRFLADAGANINTLLKGVGFRRLSRAHWFKRIYLLDEYLYARKRDSALYHFLPDPWAGRFDMDRSKARAALGIPADAHVFLHYGIGDRRKGLHLVLQALLDDSGDQHWFLLCAGELARIARSGGVSND